MKLINPEIPNKERLGLSSQSPGFCVTSGESLSFLPQSLLYPEGKQNPSAPDAQRTNRKQSLSSPGI